MSNRLTLADVQASRIPNHVGMCPTSADFISLVNEAVSRLIPRGHWEGSYQNINMCVSDGCLTYPRQIASISAVDLCGNPLDISNPWWNYMPGGDGVAYANGCARSCPGTRFQYKGIYPTFSDIIPGNKIVRLYAQSTTDYGKRVLIQGYDEHNQWIRSLDAGVWIDGFYLTLAAPFVESTFDINSVTGVQKPLTNGNVLMYSVDLLGVQRALGVYEPSETVAGYQRYFIQSFSSTDCGSNCTTKSISGIAKLNHMPVSVPTDYLYLTNLPAIKEMCQAIRYLEMDDPASKSKGEFHQRRAIKELQMEKENVVGNDTIPISMRVFGSAELSHKNIGGLM